MPATICMVDGVDLYSELGFHVQEISRPMPEVRERIIEVPDKHGYYDAGARYSRRQISLRGVFLQDTLQELSSALDTFRQLIGLDNWSNSYYGNDAVLRTLWFADESVVHKGTAQAGAAGAITLASTASAVDDYYNDMEVEIYQGSSAGQVRRIVDYVGSTKVASVGSNWGTTPTSASVYRIRENRWWKVAYAGGFDEDRLMRRFRDGVPAIVTVRFNVPDIFATGDVLRKRYTPAANGFQRIKTGTESSYPQVGIAGAVTNPEVCLGPFGYVANFDGDVTGKDIRNDEVTATFSSDFRYQTGKLEQCIGIFDNTLGTAGDVFKFDTMIDGEPPTGAIADRIDMSQGAIGFWFRPEWDYNDGVAHQLVSGYKTGVGHISLQKNSDDDLVFSLSNYDTSESVTVTASLVLAAGTWYHLVIVWSKNNTVYGSNYAQLFWGGNAAGGTTDKLTTAHNAPDEIYLGRGDGVVANLDYANCYFDDFAIWDRPLSDTEITALYNSGAGARADTISNGLLTYFDFDGTAGNAVTADALGSGSGVTLPTSSATDAITTVAAGASSVFAASDRFVLSDGTGYKKEGTVTSITGDTGINYTLSDADEVGVAATLDGSATYFSAGDVLDAGANDIVISAWINVTPSKYHGIVGKIAGGRYALAVYTNGCLLGKLNDGSAFISSTDGEVIGDETWHHVGIVFDRNGNATRYADGYATGTADDITGYTGSTDNAANLWVGRDADQGVNGYLDGSIRDVRIWIGSGIADGAANDAANMLTLATNPLGASVSFGGSAESGWWKLTDAAAETTPQDSTANNNDLTLVGGDTTNYDTHSRTQSATISKNLIADGDCEAGGIGGWTAGDAATTLAKDSTTVYKGAESIKITNGDASQSYIKQTVELTSSNGYVIRGYCYGPTSVNAASAVISINTTTPHVMSATQVGLLADAWSEAETCFDATASSHLINFGCGSITNAESGYWDDIQLLHNLVTNGGMEGAYVGGVAPGWSNNSGTPAEEASNIHSGSKAQKMTTAAEASRIYQSVTNLTVGKWYTVNAWVHAASASIRLAVGTSDALTSAVRFIYHSGSGDYERLSLVFQATATTMSVIVGHGNNLTGDYYVDDVSIIHRHDLTPTMTALDKDSLFVPAKHDRGVYLRNGATFSQGSLIFNPDEFGFVARVMPQFPGGVLTDGQDKTIFKAYYDTDDYYELWYDASEGKWKFTVSTGGTPYSAESPVQSFAVGDTLDLAGWFDTTNGSKLWIDGVVSATQSNTTGLEETPVSLYVGHDANAGQANCVLDELALLVQAPTDNELKELVRRQEPLTNTNRHFKYTGTLAAGDLLMLNGQAKKFIITAKKHDGETGTETDVLANSTVASSHAPWLSEGDEMVCFPVAIPGGAEFSYRKNWL